MAVRALVPAPREPTRERHAPLWGDQPGVAARRVRMGTRAARTICPGAICPGRSARGDLPGAICKERAAIAEHGTTGARNRGLQRLLVRGKAGVRAVLPWFALAHDMATAWRPLSA